MEFVNCWFLYLAPVASPPFATSPLPAGGYREDIEQLIRLLVRDTKALDRAVLAGATSASLEHEGRLRNRWLSIVCLAARLLRSCSPSGRIFVCFVLGVAGAVLAC